MLWFYLIGLLPVMLALADKIICDRKAAIHYLTANAA